MSRFASFIFAAFFASLLLSFPIYFELALLSWQEIATLRWIIHCFIHFICACIVECIASTSQFISYQRDKFFMFVASILSMPSNVSDRCTNLWHSCKNYMKKQIFLFIVDWHRLQFKNIFPVLIKNTFQSFCYSSICCHLKNSSTTDTTTLKKVKHSFICVHFQFICVCACDAWKSPLHLSSDSNEFKTRITFSVIFHWCNHCLITLRLNWIS